jgi:hypothetical protein
VRHHVFPRALRDHKHPPSLYCNRPSSSPSISGVSCGGPQVMGYHRSTCVTEKDAKITGWWRHNWGYARYLARVLQAPSPLPCLIPAYIWLQAGTEGVPTWPCASLRLSACDCCTIVCTVLCQKPGARVQAAPSTPIFVCCLVCMCLTLSSCHFISPVCQSLVLSTPAGAPLVRVWDGFYQGPMMAFP